jgi:hypothetical protein
MNTFIVAALLGLSAIATLSVPASADNSLTVHGVFGGNSYGR